MVLPVVPADCGGLLSIQPSCVIAQLGFGAAAVTGTGAIAGSVPT